MNPPARPTAPRPALELFEDAVALLRRLPMSAWSVYALGTAPWVAGWLWWVNDMAHHPQAADRAFRAAALLTLLWLWGRVGQALFASELRSAIAPPPIASSPPPLFPRLARLLVIQGVGQALAWFLLPLSLLLVLPFPWVWSYFQHFTCLADRSQPGLRDTFRHSLTQTLRWPGQLPWITLGAAVGGFLVAINVASAFLIVPFLLKTLLDIDTAFSLHVGTMASPTFITLTLALTYWLLNPWIKAVFALRTYDGETESTGDDLRQVFHPTPPTAPASWSVSLTLLLFLAGLNPSLSHAHAQSTPSPTETQALEITAPPSHLNPQLPTSQSLSPPPLNDRRTSLDRSLNEVLDRPEFAWRLPPPEEITELPEGPWHDWRQSLREQLLELGRQIRDLWDRLWLWFKAHFQPQPPAPGPSLDLLAWFSPAVLWTLLILGLLVGLAGWWWWRRTQGPAQNAPIQLAVAVTPDLADESIGADHLPPDRWGQLAEELWLRGEFRLALRAWYLSALAQLAAQGRIQLARGKSNDDYHRELRRRLLTHTGPVAAFAELIQTFEKVWYGSHPAVPTHRHTAEEALRRLRP